MLKNNTTDLSERDFPANQTSVANEMATTEQISKIENTDSNKWFDDNILDIGADERIPSDDTEVSDPEFPEQENILSNEAYYDEYYDEILLIERQEQDEINAIIKGYH